MIYVFLVVTYDIRDEKTRGKVRRLLRKYSFTMLTYSVYIGRGSRALAERISSRISRLLGKVDRATVILLNDFQYEVLMEITKGNISIRGEKMPVIVFYGVCRAGVTDENSRRPSDMQNESKVEGRSGSTNGAHSS
ncbi:MAG: CRISPR-associated endonuclease Cas2 [Desulfurococcaceae archaeon]